MKVSVKICGLTDPASVQAVIAAGADYAGFVHYPRSPRHIEPSQAAELKALLPASIPAVSVTVDPGDALLSDITTALSPAFLQLHGNESPERISAIRARFPALKLIKAISVRHAGDVEAAQPYYDCVDMLLFDAKPAGSGLPGGTGVSFDWSLLQGRHFPLPWMLSGGLTPGNVAGAIRETGATQVDVSSGVENTPGHKDPAKIMAFIRNASA